MKKVISEQYSLEQKKSILSKAKQIGCFTKYKNLLNISEPVEIDGQVILKAIGKQSEAEVQIYLDPKRIINPSTQKEFSWECPQLDDFIKTQVLKPTISQPEDEQPLDPIEKKEIDDIDNLIQSIEKEVEEQKPESCRKSINALYDFYVKTRDGDYNIDPNKIKKLRDNSQRCLASKEIKNKLFFSKLPLVGDKFQNRIKELQKIKQRDSKLGQFRLLENKIINKSTITEEKVIETRLKIVLENITDFESLSLNKKVKKGFRFLKEISDMKNLGLIQEDLGTLFKTMYGNSYDTSINSISEPMFNVIFTKLALENDLKNKVLENIHSKSSELIASMNDCFTLSKFISKIIFEEYMKKMDLQRNKEDIISSSFMDSVDDEMFRSNLNTKLEPIICKLYEKFTENAKNLMVRMTSL